VTVQPPPKSGVVDDAGVLSKASQGTLLKAVDNIKKETGFQLEVVTVRKLVFEADPFAFADQVIENWFPTVEEGNKVRVWGPTLLLTSPRLSAPPPRVLLCSLESCSLRGETSAIGTSDLSVQTIRRQLKPS
jgi:hypothetical protein